ncbi:MAG TPA: glycosyltransferase family 39 protein, partial [Candidatus Baltobacteraceae bacterium]|nr:glycosyltransferase family 39 protein [Candidatus Baltobacteraceae bacterium]
MIVLLGAGLRLYNLSTVPTELIADEIDLYNSVRSIVTTGHDVDGTLAPFLYSKFTRNPPMYGIAAYASTLVLGKTAFALRFPAVLFGLAAIVFVYGIAFNLTGRKDVALAAALVQSIAPVFVQFSRIAWEPGSELPFLLAGLYVLSAGRLAAAAVLLALTCYTYMDAWLYAVILGFGLCVLLPPRLRGPRFALRAAGAGFLWLVIAAPALWMCFFDPLTTSKISRISTFSAGISMRTLGIFFANYAAHFHFAFLVTTGEPQSGVTWRYLNGFGAFYWWVLPLAAAGIIAANWYVPDRGMRLWLWLWLIAYPLGGSLTNEGAPNAPRTLAGMPVFCILSGIGCIALADLARARSRGPTKRAVVFGGVVLAGVLLAISVTRFSRFYFTQYVHQNSNAWDSGTHAMFSAVRQYAPHYRRVCFSVYPAWYLIDSYIDFYLHDVPIETIDN